MDSMKRKGISKRLRFSIFTRDDFTCRYCGKQSDSVPLVIDHIIPVCEGGTNDESNLATACEPCNQGKGGITIAQAAPNETDRLRMAQEMFEQRAAAETARAAADAKDELRQTVLEFWCDRTGDDSAERSTISVMIRYVEEFGAATVFDWIQTAFERMGTRNDRRVGRYVSGIRRKIIEAAEEDEP